MFRLHKYFGKQTFFAIIMVQLLGLSHARVISQCSSEAGEIKANTDATCNTQYPYIYCNGASSAYCTNEQCLEENECNNEPVAEVPSALVPPIIQATVAPGSVPAITPPTVAPTPAQPITPATTAPGSVPAITPPTVAPTPAQPITPPTTAPVSVPAITPAATTPAAVKTTTETTATIREKCTINKKFSVQYFGNCRYFYHCVNGYFGIGDCGFYMYFDANEGKCKIRTEASCQ